MGSCNSSSILVGTSWGVSGKQIGLEPMVDGVYGVVNRQMHIGKPYSRSNGCLRVVGNNCCGGNCVPLHDNVLRVYASGRQNYDRKLAVR
jgi:hypothetical protein